MGLRSYTCRFLLDWAMRLPFSGIRLSAAAFGWPWWPWWPGPRFASGRVSVDNRAAVSEARRAWSLGDKSHARGANDIGISLYC